MKKKIKRNRRNYTSSSENSDQGAAIAVIFVAVITTLVIMSFVGVFGGIAVIITGILIILRSNDPKWHFRGTLILGTGIIMLFIGIGLFVFFNNTELGETLYDTNIQLIKVGSDFYNITSSIPKIK